VTWGSVNYITCPLLNFSAGLIKFVTENLAIRAKYSQIVFDRCLMSILPPSLVVCVSIPGDCVKLNKFVNCSLQVCFHLVEKTGMSILKLINN